MRNTLFGASVIIGTALALPAAHALSQYAEGKPLETIEYQCWYIENLGPDKNEQRTFTIEADGMTKALPACLRKYYQEQDRSNKTVRRL